MNDKIDEEFLNHPAYRDCLEKRYWPILNKLKKTLNKIEHYHKKNNSDKLPDNLIEEFESIHLFWINALNELNMVKKLII